MSDARLRTVGLAVAALGIAVAGYLTWVHYEDLKPFCVAGGGGCEQVQTSEYAEFIGIPVALIGLGGYISIFVALLVRGENARLVAAFLGLGGLGFSLYLSYLEVFVIEAICQWCVASASLMTILAAITTVRAWRGEPAAGAPGEAEPPNPGH